MAPCDGYEITAAIDFGTTYSGYAFSYHDMEKIVLNPQWLSGSRSYKVPTAILFDKEQNFIAFGIQAENEYNSYAGDDKEKKYMLFDKFKMVLYKEEDITDTSRLTAANGQSMPVLVVFSSALSYLKQHLLDTINKERLNNKNNISSNKMLNDKDVLWVITVPAIWSEKSKLFMIKAAKMAHIDRENVCIALEPECAAIYCNKLYCQDTDENNKIAKVGAKYMVIDLGGGTCDIIIHELLKDGKIKEIKSATGIDAGGNTVDKILQDFLGEIITLTVLDDLKKTYPASWKSIERDLESAKKSASENIDSVSIMLHRCVDELYNGFNEMHIWEAFESEKISSKARDNVSIQGKDRLRIKNLIIKNMIRKVCELVKNEIHALIKISEVKLDYVILAGGFSNSSIVLEEMQEHFQPIPVVRPPEAELAVLMGAVLYGLRENQITSRISRKTYGLDYSRPFENGDPESCCFFDDENTKRCVVLFTFVTIGESIETGKKIEKSYNPAIKSQKRMTFNFYSSNKETVEYCNEEGVYNVGALQVEMPDTSGGKDRKVNIAITLGKTYIQIDATDKNSGQVFNTTFDFLYK